MKKKRRAEITVETLQRFVIRGAGSSAQEWCAECAAVVRMIAPDEAGMIADVSARTIYRWVETDRIHFVETPVGRLLVCLDSLKKYSEGIPARIRIAGAS